MSGDHEDPLKAQTVPPPKPFVAGPRLYGYAVALFILFALAAVQVGMSSAILHRHGNFMGNYPDAMAKRGKLSVHHSCSCFGSRRLTRTSLVVGLDLFNGIICLLTAMFAYASPLYLLAFLLFAESVMWVVSAGILYQQTPYTGTSCPTVTGPWLLAAGDCKESLTLHAVSWTLWIVTLALAVAIVANTAMAAKRGQPLRNLMGA